MTIDRLILLLSRTKVEALVVYHMISCFPAISLVVYHMISCFPAISLVVYHMISCFPAISLVVYHMISCFPAISLRFLPLMSFSVDFLSFSIVHKHDVKV